jgi:nitroreductase
VTPEQNRPSAPILHLSVDQALTTTRAVRRRLDLSRPVDRSTIKECFEVAFQAPSADNRQAWAWVAVDDSVIKVQMADLYRRCITEIFNQLRDRGEEGQAEFERMGMSTSIDHAAAQRIYASVDHLNQHLEDVPVLVVGMMRGRTENLGLLEASMMWGSVLPAAWSFMIALRERGMGSCWTTAHLSAEQEMAEILQIPSQFTQIGLFPVAYTLGVDFKPGPRADVDAAVCWNKWGSD